MKTFILSLILLLPCLATAQNNVQRQKDSLRNVVTAAEGREKLRAYQRLAACYYVEAANNDLMLDSLLAIYRELDAEALHQEAYDIQGLVRLNTLSVYLNRNNDDEIFKLAPEYLNYTAKHEVWKWHYAIYRVYLTAYIRTGKYEKAIEGAQKMYDEAKQREHDEGKGMAFYVMSTVYGKMSRREEEVKYIRESIEILKNVDGLMNTVTAGYFRLCEGLLSLKRNDEFLQEMQEYEKAIYRFEESSKIKQYNDWMNFWRNYLQYYIQNEEYDKAEIYCDKLESVGKGPIIMRTVFSARARIYHYRKQYDKALEMVDKAMVLAGEDINLINAAQATKLMILCSKKGVGDIYELFKEATTLRDSIRNIEFNAQLDELRTIYEVDKLEKDNKIITIEKQRNRNYFLFALGGCFLLGATLIIYIYYSRTIVRKNRGLYRQIKEQDRLAEDLDNERRKNRQLQLLLKPNVVEFQDDDEMLFGQLMILMKEQQLYTNCDIKRQDVAQQIGISDRHLHDCIKNNTGMSFTEYLNTLRLSYSRELLANEGKNFTIDAVALDSGFKSRSNFYHLFREKYGLTPEEFRKSAKISS